MSHSERNILTWGILSDLYYNLKSRRLPRTPTVGANGVETRDKAGTPFFLPFDRIGNPPASQNITDIKARWKRRRELRARRKLKQEPIYL